MSLAATIAKHACPTCGLPRGEHVCAPLPRAPEPVRPPPGATLPRRCARCGVATAHEWVLNDGRPACGACACAEPSDEREVCW